MSKEAERFAERYERELYRWKAYQQNRRTGETIDGGAIIRDLSAAIEGRDPDQLPLRHFS